MTDDVHAMGRFAKKHGDLALHVLRRGPRLAGRARPPARGQCALHAARSGSATDPDGGWVHPKELHGLLLGISRTGLAWDWSGRKELVPSAMKRRLLVLAPARRARRWRVQPSPPTGRRWSGATCGSGSRCRRRPPRPRRPRRRRATPASAWPGPSKRDGEMFDFDYVDYQPGWFSERDTKEMARDLGRGEAEKAFPRAKFKYVRDEPVTLQGWDGYALDIEDPGGAVVMMRTYIVRDRLYRLLVTAKNDAGVQGARPRASSTSLRLAETRQPRSGHRRRDRPVLPRDATRSAHSIRRFSRYEFRR